MNPRIMVPIYFALSALNALVGYMRDTTVSWWLSGFTLGIAYMYIDRWVYAKDTQGVDR